MGIGYCEEKPYIVQQIFKETAPLHIKLHIQTESVYYLLPEKERKQIHYDFDAALSSFWKRRPFQGRTSASQQHPSACFARILVHLSGDV